MYDVSEEYLEALRLSTRSDRIAGTITLPGSEDSISIDDENLVSGTLKIVRELCGDSYRIGTFNLSSVSFSVFTDSGPGTDFTGASVELSYFLDTGGGEYEEVPLGRYLIDPVLSTRRKNILSIIAYDEGIKTDRAPSGTLRSMECTPAELIEAVCDECGLDTDITAGSLDGFPNSGLTVRADSVQIQSCRDIIMWCASLVCGYAVVTRDSKLAVIPAKYSVTGSGTSIVCDRTIEEDERNSIYVTDTRAYIKYLTGYEGNKIVNYTSTYVPQDEQASPAAYVLEKNPLLASSSDGVCRNANMAWLAYIDSFKQRGVKAEIFGDPAIDTGDTIRFTGGDVDQRHGIIGVVTSCEWRYRGYQDIICSAAVCTAGVGTSSGTRSRRQTEKRVDAIQPGGVGEWLDEEHTIERFNDYELNTSDMKHDHICGMNNVGDSEDPDGGYGYNLYFGYGNRNYGLSARDNLLGGNNNTNRGGQNLIGGMNNTNTGNKNVIAGQENTVSAYDSIVAGQYNTVAGSYEIVNGIRNNVSGGYNQQGNIVNGNGNTISGSQNIVNGNTINTSASRSLIVGQGHSGYGDMAIVCGNGASINSLYYLMIGNYGNIFTVDTSGNVGAAGQYGTIGADYAEFFEWEDGNPDSEYRRGILVALDGDKIIPAQGDGFIGIISDNPAVLGNMTPDKLSDPKFAPVGLIGRLVVRDNGTCRPNGYVSARDGMAVSTLRRTPARVLRRIDETHVEVLLK